MKEITSSNIGFVRDKVKYFIAVISFLFMVIPYVDAYENPTELALFEQIPIVVTPSKKPQPITESPASVYVVTQEDIKQSGSISLWDVLREVPGMDVVQSSIGHADVSMRGFADPLANKTLLLIDGRSVYLPLQGTLLWEMLPVQLEEIDRIEVVKGPVASLYGANANLGLINIITKNPDQINGGIFSSSVGSQKLLKDSLVIGKQKNDSSFKFSAGWQEADAFESRGLDALDVGQSNVYLQHKISDDSDIALSGGFSKGDFYLLSNTTMIADQWYYGPISNQIGYLKADYQNGNLKTRIFWNKYHETFQTVKTYIVAKIDTYDLESRYTLDLFDNHAIIIGGGGRYDLAESNIFSETDDKKHDQGIWDVFLQDEYKLSDLVTLNGSARVDYYAVSGYNPSYRLSANFYPNKRDVYRVAVSSSFRNPTLSDYFINLPIDVTGTGVIQTAYGNKQVDPETYFTVEGSYQGRRMDGRLRPFVDLFWTHINDLIESNSTGLGPFGLDSTFNNLGKAISAGGELGTEYDFNEHLTFISNYALNHVSYNDASERHYNPLHKINTGFKVKLLDGKFNAKLFTHYVSSARTTIGETGKVPQYMTGSLWFGYMPRKNLELSVAGTNILFNEHPETIGGDEIGTRVIGKVEVTF